MKRVIITVLEVSQIPASGDSHLVEVSIRDESKSTSAVAGENPKYNQKFILYDFILYCVLFPSHT
jgi:hypothetical protein